MVLLARGVAALLAVFTLTVALPSGAAAQGTATDPAAQLDPAVTGPLRDALCAVPGLLVCPAAEVAETVGEAAGEAIGNFTAGLVEGPIAALDQAAAEYTNEQIVRVLNVWVSLGEPINVEVANELVISANVITGSIAGIQFMIFTVALVWTQRRGEAVKEFGYGTFRWYIISAAGVLFLTQLVTLADAGAVIALSDAVIGENGIINTEDTPGWALFLLPFIWPLAWLAEQVFFVRLVLLTIIGGFWPLIAALAMRNRNDALFRATTGTLVALSIFPAVFAAAGWVFVQIQQSGITDARGESAAPEFVSTVLSFIALMIVVLILLGKAAWMYAQTQIARIP